MCARVLDARWLMSTLRRHVGIGLGYTKLIELQRLSLSAAVTDIYLNIAFIMLLTKRQKRKKKKKTWAHFYFL